MTVIVDYDVLMVDLRLLAALEAIVDEGTFARAAARLGYTQSTLSQQVASLERDLGGAVLDRPGGPKPARLTPFGRVVLEHARTLRTAAEQASHAFERFRAGEGRVDIGTFQTVTNVLLPPLLRRLREEQPGCDVRLFEVEASEPRLEGRDLVFFDSPPPPGVDGRLIMADDHVLVAPRGAFPDGPLPRRALDGLPLVALPPICDQGRIEQLLASGGTRPHVVFRTADNQAVVSMVRAGLGCAVLPTLAVGPDTDLSLHPLVPPLPPREIHLHWLGTLSPLAARVVALAGEEAAGLSSATVRVPHHQREHDA